MDKLPSFKRRIVGSIPIRGTMKRYLCICQYGHSRSVALARLLQEKGNKAVAIGVGTGGDAVEPLSDWAEIIYVLQPHYIKYVPERNKSKIKVIDVGPDIWSNPYNTDLRKILEEKLASIA